MRALNRIFAAALAATACIGLVVQFAVIRSNDGASATLWVMLAFFTILTNLLVAIVFSVVAIRSAIVPASILAGTTLCILLVGVIYTFLLHGLVELSGGSAVANALLHWVTPVLAVLFWMTYTPKGGLLWRDPLLWAIYPLTYLAYALARGAATGKYAYPFLDVASLGWAKISFNTACISAAFLLSGFALVFLDHQAASGTSAK